MTPEGKATASADAPPFDVLLQFLKRDRGFDFSGYKRTSLERRVAKRMEAAGVDDVLAYIDYLEVNPAEFEELFDTVLINVTSFFRDPPMWEYMAAEIVPALLERVDVGSHVRVWCAGCASGQETYTMAMILANALGEEAYAERVKIYATDVDDDALAQARLARYSSRQVESVPPEYLERFFERSEGAWSFRKDLRRTVIFGRNDLVQDAPISRIDLLVCRNTLIYFNAETQQRVLERFNFALNPWGYILLGKSEMLLSHGDLFKPVDVKRRVYAKVTKPTLRDSLWFMADGAHGDGDGRLRAGAREVAFDAAPVAQVVIDADGSLIVANVAARGLLGLAGSDVGRPLKDLEMSFRPVELSSHVERAREERIPVSTGPVTLTLPSGDVRHLEVAVTPLMRRDELLGTTITYADVSPRQRVEQELEQTKREVETAYEELESAVEELETTNEELQSTNEELETTNEELQSTNEELETMNEELQSTNEELETINDELRQSTEQFDEVNGFLEAILTSLGMAVVVVDKSQTVRVWNSHAADMWGVRGEEAVGQHLLSLDIGLPLEEVRAALRGVIDGGERRTQVTLDALNRRGKPIHCLVTCLSLDTSPPGGVSGAMVLMEEVEPEPAADAA